ncbi:MAG TPA: hypothetical protein DD381_04585 [Lentisphaeria bacterium]|nr:hypothetical protein [Lentisphaeria bacterium]
MISSGKKINYYSLDALSPRLAGILLMGSGLLHLIYAPLLYYGYIHPLYVITDLANDTGIFDKAVTTAIIILGIFELILGIGIYLKKKQAMLLAILMVFVLLIKYIFIRFSIVTAVVEFLFLIMLVIALKHHGATNTQGVRRLKDVVAWLSIFLALLFGIFGSYMLRNQYNNLHSLLDAVYYTITTYSTVGYGDITPITNEAKIFTSLMILIGIGSFVTTLSFVFAPMVENKLKGIFSIMGKITNIKDHVIICGFNRLGKALAVSLENTNKPYLVIEKSADKIPELEEINANFIIDSPSKKEILIKANIKKAVAVMCVFENDAENIITIMAIKEILAESKHSREIKIITRIENDYNAEKYKSIGVDKIVSPANLSSEAMLNGTI